MSRFFNDDNSDSDVEIKINSNYAEDYNNCSRKEELSNLTAKYGEVVTDDSSSSDEDDENIENPRFNKEFYKTLAYLKKKDPCIYDEDIKFFNNSSGTTEHTESENKIGRKLKKEKVFLHNYRHKFEIDRNGQFSNNEDEDNTKEKITIHCQVGEEEEMKNPFKHVKEESEDTDNEDNELVIQTKEDRELEKEKLYKKWLKGKKLELDAQEQKELKPLREFWTDPNLDADETFLRDYILNNKHMDKESSNVELDYEQIAHDSDENLSEDERNIKKQEEFEHKYNFRFEEPDPEFIKRYPRTMENSMRRKDTCRAQKRVEARKKKEEEKHRKKEELKQLKALKRKEIEEKIEKLKEITGNNDINFDNVDFDADFDPNEHDKRMKELFNEKYYAGAEDDMKPEFPDIDEEFGIENTWDDYNPNDIEDAPHEESHCEDPDFNMDADYDGSHNLQSELLENTRKKKKKRRSKFATLIATEKPKFDPKQFPSYEEYFDRYYSLDYEDMIGDLPCRFKYRKVVPNDYGLSVEEILMADDKELNKWCSLQQALRYKPEHIEVQEVRSYKQKASNKMLKRKILKSLYTEPEEQKDTSADEQTTTKDSTDSKKRRRKKKTKSNNFNVDSTNTVAQEKTAKTAEDNIRDNSHDMKNYVGQGTQEKNTVNEGNVRKRKNKLGVVSDGPRPKKVKTERKVSSRAKEDQVGKDNEEMALVRKTAFNPKERNKWKKNRKLQLNEDKRGKSKSTDPVMMSLNAERLKMYGINAKKFKNKLKYGKKKY